MRSTSSRITGQVRSPSEVSRPSAIVIGPSALADRLGARIAAWWRSLAGRLAPALDQPVTLPFGIINVMWLESSYFTGELDEERVRKRFQRGGRPID